jgi:hypothetical protein
MGGIDIEVAVSRRAHREVPALEYFPMGTMGTNSRWLHLHVSFLK